MQTGSKLVRAAHTTDALSPLAAGHRWSDFNLVPNYSHWGVLLPVNVSEPNNRPRAPEYCAVANYSQSYTDAWGHSDTSCAGSYLALCSVSGTPGTGTAAARTSGLRWPPPLSAVPLPPAGAPPRSLLLGSRQGLAGR